MSLNVTAIGEILYDIYPDQKRIGGAPFNFIYHVWKLLGKANFISSVGNDENGTEILNHLNKIGFPANHIFVDENYPTGTVLVALDENKSPHFTMCGYNCFDYFVLDKKSIALIEHKTDLLYFGTFGQRNAAARKTIQSTFGKNIKYFCDLNLRHEFFTKEMIEESLRTSNVIKINEHELTVLQSYFNLHKETLTAVNQLLEKFNINLIAVTFGKDGAILSNKEYTDYYRSESLEVIDTLGAGDAYSAIVCIGYLFNMDMQKTNLLANQFALDICRTLGALASDEIYEKYKSLLFQTD
jgi:fructokinase